MRSGVERRDHAHRGEAERVDDVERAVHCQIAMQALGSEPADGDALPETLRRSEWGAL
jgi:hypothetical protein